MPVRTVGELMSSPAVSVDEMAGLKLIAELLSRRGFNGVPVTTRLGRLVGIITEDDLIAGQDHRARHVNGVVARDIMTRNPITIKVDAPAAVAAERLHERHLKSLPVVDDEGALVGMLTRRDLLKLITRPDREIAREIKLALKAESVDPREVQFSVRRGVVTFTGWIDRHGEEDRLRACTEGVPGVVGVRTWLVAEEVLR